MTETTPTPELHIATPTTGNDGKVEFTSVPSKVKMQEFKPEEIALINDRLKALADATGTDALKRMGTEQAIIAKNTQELIKSLHQARWDNELLSQEEVDKTITADHFEKADANETLIPPPIPEAEKPEDAIAQATEFIKNPPKKSSDFYKIVAKLPVIGPLITAIIDSMRGGYSFEAEENFEAQVVPMLSTLGIELPTDPAAKKALGKSTMEKLGQLGVPLESTQAFFKFITDPLSDLGTIPSNLQDIFQAGKENFLNISALNPDPLLAMWQILGFTVEKTNTAPGVPWTPDSAPLEAPKVENEVIIWELKLTGKPEDIQAYKSLEDTAKKILGQNFNAKIITETEKIKEVKPEDQLRAMSVTVFKQIVEKLRNVYGADFASKMKDTDDTTRNILTNNMDGTTPIDEKSVKTMAEILSDKNLEKIFWIWVKKMEEYVTTWKEKKKTENPGKTALIEKYNKIGDTVLSATTGYRMTPSDAKHEVITEAISKIGYAWLIEKNMTQIGQFSYLLESANEALIDKTLQIIQGIPK